MQKKNFTLHKICFFVHYSENFAQKQFWRIISLHTRKKISLIIRVKFRRLYVNLWHMMQNKPIMSNEQIERTCIEKEEELLKKYFGNLTAEAAKERPETIGEYTKDLPQKIEQEYYAFLDGLWKQYAPEESKNSQLVLEERKLRKLLTDDSFDMIEEAYKDAIEQTLWEKITKSNHKDVTYYKGLLHKYTQDVLMLMRKDFLEEITNNHIKNKSFEED